MIEGKSIKMYYSFSFLVLFGSNMSCAVTSVFYIYNNRIFNIFFVVVILSMMEIAAHNNKSSHIVIILR